MPRDEAPLFAVMRLSKHFKLGYFNYQPVGGSMKTYSGRLAVVAALIAACAYMTAAKVIDMDRLFEQKIQQSGLAKVSAATRTAMTEAAVGSMRSGDILLLSRQYDLGDVDFSALPDNVTVRYGQNGRVFLRGDKSGLIFLNVDARFIGGSKNEFLAKGRTSTESWLRNSVIVEGTIPNENQENNHYVALNGGPYKVVDLSGKTFKNCSAAWVRYDNLFNHDFGPFIYLNDVDATGSRIYGIVEHNYCVKNPSVDLTNVRNFTIGTGDTEGSASAQGCYSFKNCTKVNYVGHRIFKSHSRDCQGMAYMVSGNDDLRFYCTVDIGDNKSNSMTARNNSNLKFFGAFFEEPVDIDGSNSNVFKQFFTPNGFGGEEGWREPAYLEEEIVVDYNGYTIDKNTSSAADPTGELPVPPVVPSIFNKSFVPADKLAKQGATAKESNVQEILESERAQKKSESWGSEALARGADATGQRSSSAIFQQLINERDFVEIPAGRFLFSEPVHMPGRAGKKVVFSGAGKNKTEIIMSGDFTPFVMGEIAGFAKSGPGGMAKAANVLEDMTLNGRNQASFGEKIKGTGYSSDVNAPGGVVAGGQTGGGGQTVHRRDVIYRNFSDAGIIVGTGSLDMNAMGGWDGFDQCWFVNLTFENCGYGMFNNNGMIDKQLYYNCTFTDMSKGGLYFTSTHMFEASSIVGCTFTNVDGAGVYFGHNFNRGYHPGPATVQDCEFIECGNEEYAAIELSYMRQGLVANNKIVIKTKPFKYAYRGTGQILQGLYVDVDKSKMASGGAAIALRHPRRSYNNRLTGNYVVNCYANAPLVFIEDIDKYEGANADDNHWFGSIDPYPYLYTHVFYNSKFDDGAQSFDYAMVNTEKDGTVKQTVVFDGEATGIDIAQPNINRQKVAPREVMNVYDIRGRKIGVADAIRSSSLGRGVYQMHSPVTGKVKRELVVK
jgi:hypothetical protein